MAPELLKIYFLRKKDLKYDKMIDVYSFGYKFLQDCEAPYYLR